MHKSSPFGRNAKGSRLKCNVSGTITRHRSRPSPLRFPFPPLSLLESTVMSLCVLILVLSATSATRSRALVSMIQWDNTREQTSATTNCWMRHHSTTVVLCATDSNSSTYSSYQYGTWSSELQDYSTHLYRTCLLYTSDAADE